MRVKGVQCGYCLDRIWSAHARDWVSCSCGSTFVDGGQRWEGAMRVGWTPPLPSPQVIEFDVQESTEVTPETPEAPEPDGSEAPT